MYLLSSRNKSDVLKHNQPGSVRAYPGMVDTSVYGHVYGRVTGMNRKAEVYGTDPRCVTGCALTACRVLVENQHVNSP